MLNSGDTFIVVTPGLSTAYLWRGSGSCESEYNCGTSLLDNLKMVESHQVFNEGEEPEEFWTALGGKGEYSREKIAWDTIGGFEPRLFNVSNSTGFMWVKEIPNFTQEDLLNTDVFFLDAYHTIFIWIGRLAEKQEVTQARVRAEQYLESVRDSRNKDEVAFVECQAGHSPYNIRCHFIQWSDAISQSWIDEDPLEKLLAENRSKAAAEEEKANNPFAGFLDPATTTFTYEEIKGKFPKGIKGNMKEYYLSDAEFQQVLGMTKEEWGKLKLWKQEQKKQDVGIF